jgi:3-hydroxyisobutyrate dehydrogenase-like beta-hydroxyacid dehydrogenase
MSDVSVIGLGAMGSALADAFLRKGHSVSVWNRTPGKAAALVANGAAEAATVADAMTESKTVVVCLLTYDTVHEVLAPAGGVLGGRALVNLTNGTPAQARKMAEWAAECGAAYLDGGIMAVPPMIGGPEALILYSGLEKAFDENRALLESLGSARYFGTDAGLAALHDLALLTGMYGLFSGAIHATALIGTERIPAREFMPLLIGWLNAMMGALPGLAEQVDTRDYTGNVVSNLAMQASGYPNLVEASRNQGLSTELVEPMGDLMRKAVAAGYGNADLASLVELVRRRSG